MALLVAPADRDARLLYSVQARTPAVFRKSLLKYKEIHFESCSTSPDNNFAHVDKKSGRRSLWVSHKLRQSDVMFRRFRPTITVYGKHFSGAVFKLRSIALHVTVQTLWESGHSGTKEENSLEVKLRSCETCHAFAGVWHLPFWRLPIQKKKSVKKLTEPILWRHVTRNLPTYDRCSRVSRLSYPYLWTEMQTKISVHVFLLAPQNGYLVFLNFWLFIPNSFKNTFSF